MCIYNPYHPNKHSTSTAITMLELQIQVVDLSLYNVIYCKNRSGSNDVTHQRTITGCYRDKMHNYMHLYRRNLWCFGRY